MSKQPTRFSQAQILIAALFTVVMTGKMPAEPKIKPPRKLSNKIRNGRRSEFSRGGRYEGIIAEVAKECGVAKGYVFNVKWGSKTSARISKALQLAVQKRDEQPWIAPPQLNSRQREQLRKSKRYAGLRVQIAKDLGVRKVIVYNVVSGCTSSARITQALLDAMARRDAEHAAKQVSK